MQQRTPSVSEPFGVTSHPVSLGGRSATAGRGSADYRVREGSSMKLYGGNISFTTTNEDLAEACGRPGTVTGAQVGIDRASGRGRWVACAEVSDGAEAALAAMHGANFIGRTLTVNEARPREDRGGGGGGGGGGGRGGYGGGGGG